MTMLHRFPWILLALAGAVLAGGLVSPGPAPSGLALGEDSRQASDTDNPGQVQALASLEAHRAAHRSHFSRVVQFMPFYSIASGDRASVFLLNMFADTIPVTLTAYDSYGNPYTLFEHQVAPRTHLELSLNQALASAGSRYRQGSLTIQYRGQGSTVSAWAVLQRGSHATEIPFSLPSQFRSTTLRAFWDSRPSATLQWCPGLCRDEHGHRSRGVLGDCQVGKARNDGPEIPPATQRQQALPGPREPQQGFSGHPASGSCRRPGLCRTAGGQRAAGPLAGGGPGGAPILQTSRTRSAYHGMAANLAHPLQSERQEPDGYGVGLRPCQWPQTGPHHPGGRIRDGGNGQSGDFVGQSRLHPPESSPHHRRTSGQPPIPAGLGSQAGPFRTGRGHCLLSGRPGAPQRDLSLGECEPWGRVDHLAQPGGVDSQSGGPVGLGGRRQLCAARNQHCAGGIPIVWTSPS